MQDACDYADGIFASRRHAALDTDDTRTLGPPFPHGVAAAGRHVEAADFARPVAGKTLKLSGPACNGNSCPTSEANEASRST
jgi:hypothetical protein